MPHRSGVHAAARCRARCSVRASSAAPTGAAARFDRAQRRPVRQDDELRRTSMRVGQAGSVGGEPARVGGGRRAHVRVGDTNAEFMDGLPLLKPPYGHLVAIDLNRGAIKWRVPFGDTPSLRRHPALEGRRAAGGARRRRRAGGARDRPAGWCSPAAAICAFHAARRGDRTRSCGASRRSATRPTRTPMTYRSASGRQFVVVATGGGEDASLVAFALDRRPSSVTPACLDRGHRGSGISSLASGGALSISGVVHDSSGAVVVRRAASSSASRSRSRARVDHRARRAVLGRHDRDR